MAIIYSYPTATPVGTDTIIGTQQAVDETGDNLTVTFTMASIANYVTASILPSGTINYLPLFSSPSTFADSIVSQSTLGDRIFIGGGFTVSGTGIIQGALTVDNDITVAGDIQGDTASLGSTSINGALSMGDNKIINLLTPTNPQDAATKAYVDAGDLESEFAVTLRQPARFTEAVTIGDPIYITGYNTGLDRFEVARAQAGDPSKMPAVGLADGNYSINEDGNFITHGGIEGLNTNSFDIGDVAYVGALGGLTNVKPAGSNLIQNIGIVSKKSGGNGSLEAIAIGRTNDVPNLTPGKIWVGSTGNTIESTVVSINEANDKVTIAGTIDLNDGNNSTIIGTSAGGGGINITAVGYNALASNTGSNASGFGREALYNNAGANASGFGSSALQFNTGVNSSGFGYAALYNNTGSNASGFGRGALQNNTGDNSSGFGYNALQNNSGSNNTAFGHTAGYESLYLTGSDNTFLGANASYGTNTTISNSTAVGANVTLTDSNTVILGSGANVGIGTTSPNYKLDVDDIIGVKDSLIVNHVPGTFPRPFPPYDPAGKFNTEPTGRIGVVNNDGALEWAFSAVSKGDSESRRSGLLHSKAGAYRLILNNITEESVYLNSEGDSFIKGRLAIGKDIPTQQLDVEGSVAVSGDIYTDRVRRANVANELRINQARFFDSGNIANKYGTDIGATLHLRTNEPLANQSVIAITRGGQGTGFPSGIIQNNTGEYTFLLRDSSNTQRVNFSTITSNTAFIDNGKIVLCGNNNSTDGAIFIDGKKWSSGAKNAVMTFNKTGIQADTALEFRVGGNLRGSINYSDTGTSYNVASDYRLKENVVEITDGIERLKQLKPSRFNFISDADKVVDGFIAHEVQEVIPEAVTGKKDATEEYEVTPAEHDDYGNLVSEAVIGTREAYQQIDQAKIVPLLTAALQEAVSKIESLEARIQALENN